MNSHIDVDRKGFERVRGAVGYKIRNSQGEETLEQVVTNDLAIVNTK